MNDRAPNTPTDIIILVNIVMPDHDKLSLDAVIAQAGGSPALAHVGLEMELNIHDLLVRDWRSIAARLDDLVASAKRAGEGVSGVRYVVAGQAPLPVFAYLGQRMRRMNGQILVINHVQQTDRYDIVPQPPELAAGAVGSTKFEVRHPPIGRRPQGTIALTVRCSSTYKYDEDHVDQVLKARCEDLLGSYHIYRDSPSRAHPLSADDLPEILRHIDEFEVFIATHKIECHGIFLALGGPAWIAFWVGHRLNPQVLGRIDLANFVPRRDYVPALSSPMHKAPWFAGKAQLLFLTAEPHEQTRVLANDALEQIRRSLDDAGPYAIELRGATRPEDIAARLRSERPDILHVWLHGNESGYMYFQNDRGRSARMPVSDFLVLLRSSGARPSIIVMSACHLADPAWALLEVAECVVGMTDAVAIDSAKAFASTFYRELASGSTLAEAFEAGKVQANLAFPTKKDLIAIKYAAHMQNGNVVLFPKPERR